jgi:hypothetical protein
MVFALSYASMRLSQFQLLLEEIAWWYIQSKINMTQISQKDGRALPWDDISNYSNSDVVNAEDTAPLTSRHIGKFSFM